MRRILIVEDDVNLGTTLAGALETLDYEVLYLIHGEGIMDEFRKFKPDLVILDVMLNGALDGFDIARLIRLEYNTPILFTTSRDGTEDLKSGFSIACTDYIRKPYRFVEVKLRLDNLWASVEKESKTIQSIHIGNFFFNPEDHSLKYECEKIYLNNCESAVLVLLCKNIDKYITREDIIKSVWNENNTKLKEGSLNNTLTRLRKYMNQDNNVKLESRIGLGVKITIL